MATFQLRQWHLHLFYIAVIVLMVRHWQQVRQPDPVAAAFTETTLRMSKKILGNEVETRIHEIRKVVGNYPSAGNIRRCSIADATVLLGRRLTDDLTNFLSNYIQVSPENTWQILSLTRDSLISFSENNPETVQMLDSLLPDSTSFFYLEKHLSASELASQIKVRLTIAVNAVLIYLSANISGNDISCFAKKPEMSSQNWAPKVGENFQAEVFMQTYENSVYRNQTMRIDGALLEVKDGMAIFQKRYNSPGLKKILVEIEDKNPLTGQTEVYKKEFSVRVLE